MDEATALPSPPGPSGSPPLCPASSWPPPPAVSPPLQLPGSLGLPGAQLRSQSLGRTFTTFLSQTLQYFHSQAAVSCVSVSLCVRGSQLGGSSCEDLRNTLTALAEGEGAVHHHHPPPRARPCNSPGRGLCTELGPQCFCGSWTSGLPSFP